VVRDLDSIDGVGVDPTKRCRAHQATRYPVILVNSDLPVIVLNMTVRTEAQDVLGNVWTEVLGIQRTNVCTMRMRRAAKFDPYAAHLAGVVVEGLDPTHHRGGARRASGNSCCSAWHEAPSRRGCGCGRRLNADLARKMVAEIDAQQREEAHLVAIAALGHPVPCDGIEAVVPKARLGSMG